MIVSRYYCDQAIVPIVNSVLLYLSILSTEVVIRSFTDAEYISIHIYIFSIKLLKTIYSKHKAYNNKLVSYTFFKTCKISFCE